MTSNICPVCDKQFDSRELFHKHIDEHLNEPTINDLVKKIPIKNTKTELFDEKTLPTINLKEIFSEEEFEKLVQFKMEKIFDDREKIKKQIFIQQIKKINQRNPFLYMPYFIRDFMNGVSTKDIEYKYHIWHFMDHRNITHNILGFKENRYLSRKYNNAFELNFKNVHWKNKYQELKDNCKFFKNELEELIFKNVLQAGIIFLLMDKQLDKDAILHEIKGLKDHYDLYHFVDEELSNRFNELLKINLEERIDGILFSLKKEGVIKRNTIGSGKLITTFSIDKIKKSIVKELEFEGQIRYSILKNSIIGQFPGLRLIPKFGVFGTAWRELIDEKIIHIEYESSRRNDIVFFLHEHFEKIDDSIKSINSSNQIIPFKGRKISPEKFISEIQALEKGDFNDADDQVTRLAGLVLAESVNLQSPSEEFQEFDFSINLKDYSFRPEQLVAMEKLNFKINSEIFHVKVMIDEILNLKKYAKLKEKLPTNEQGVVITFEKIPSNVKGLLEDDFSIQIIDEEGVKIWVSITSRLPARVNSICKISQDPLSKLENKLVKVNSVFYETGIALVSLLPEMNEVTVLVRCLEEITLFELTPSDFKLFSKNYYEFLIILFTLSTNENLIHGFFKNKFIEEPKKIKNQFEINFEYNTVHLDLKEFTKHSIIKCDCIQFAENSLSLCSHLVSALDYIFRRFSFGDKSWSDNNNTLKRALDIIISKNIEIILDRLAIAEENGQIQKNSRLSNFVFGMNKIKSDC